MYLDTSFLLLDKSHFMDFLAHLARPTHGPLSHPTDPHGHISERKVVIFQSPRRKREAFLLLYSNSLSRSRDENTSNKTTMVRRGGRFMRFVATTNAQVEKEMELEASHPFYGESVEYAQMRQERERQRAALDQRRHRENTKPISVRVSC